MSRTHDFDEEAVEALLSGTGGEINGDIAAAIGAVRSKFVSQPPVVGPELATVIGAVWLDATSSRRHRPMRSTVALRRLVVATVAFFGLTGSLAVANALPAPMQNAIASVGIGSTKHDNATPNATDDELFDATTTTDANVTTTTAGSDDGSTTTLPRDNHGAEVSAIARDKTVRGCEHGRAVSAVASGKTNDKSCAHATTTTTTVVGTMFRDDAPADKPGKASNHESPKANGENHPAGKGKHTSEDSDD